MTVQEVTAAGLAAATVVARDQGLACGQARVLSAWGNLLVHLAPSPVVARVATLTAFSRRGPVRLAGAGSSGGGLRGTARRPGGPARRLRRRSGSAPPGWVRGQPVEVPATRTAVTGIAVPSPVRLGPFGKIRDLEAAVWALGMAYQYPARYQRQARDLLARVLPGPGRPR